MIPMFSPIPQNEFYSMNWISFVCSQFSAVSVPVASIRGLDA